VDDDEIVVSVIGAEALAAEDEIGVEVVTS
jgi:hypothetical protein